MLFSWTQFQLKRSLCEKPFVQSEKLLSICGENECKTFWSTFEMVDHCCIWSWISSDKRLWNVIMETYFQTLKDVFKAFLSGLIILPNSSLYHSGGLKYFPFFMWIMLYQSQVLCLLLLQNYSSLTYVFYFLKWTLWVLGFLLIMFVYLSGEILLGVSFKNRMLE